MDLFLEAGDQFAVGGDQRLLGFNLGHDGLLCDEGWEGDSRVVETANRQLRLCGSLNDRVSLCSEIFGLKEMKEIAA